MRSLLSSLLCMLEPQPSYLGYRRALPGWTRAQKRNQQSPEEKQAALVKADEKRERKRIKRYANYRDCLFNSAIFKHNFRLHHWQTRKSTASPA